MLDGLSLVLARSMSVRDMESGIANAGFKKTKLGIQSYVKKKLGISKKNSDTVLQKAESKPQKAVCCGHGENEEKTGSR